MSNNYKYSTLNDRQRMARIRGGDEDVYNAEKALNARLKKDRIAVGLSTSDIDKWDTAIDSAYNASVKSAKKASVEKYANPYISDINNAAIQSFKELRKQRDESIENVQKEAEAALEFFGEWLAVNGYSKDGSLAKKTKKEIEDALKDAIETIGKNYKNEVSSIRERLRSYIK